MTFQEKIEFYLDPMEFINKPRRVFMGLEYKLEDVEYQEIYSKKAINLAKQIIQEAQKDFYKHTLPKFEKKIHSLYDNEEEFN